MLTQLGYNRRSRALVWGDIAPGASLARALGLKEVNFAGAGPVGA
jgi:hypothetical protein